MLSSISVISSPNILDILPLLISSIINTYATDEEHNEVAALFSADLNDDLNKNEREKALNDTVIKVKSNSLEHALNNTSDGHQMQELLMQQMKLKNIYIHI